MRGHVDILTLSPKSTLRFSLFVKRIIATEAHFTFWAWSDYSVIIPCLSCGLAKNNWGGGTLNVEVIGMLVGNFL